MPDLTCIPIFLFPEQSLLFKRSEVVPGVTIVSAEGLRRSLVKSIDERMKRNPEHHQPPFHRTHFILIDHDAYLLGLTPRLAHKGKKLRTITLDDKTWIDTHAILRQVLISAVLTGQIQFRCNTVFRIVRENNQDRLQSYSPLHGETGSYMIRPGFRPTPIRRVEFRRTALILDRYYRSGTWWEDRLGSALAHFWDAMCTPHHDHAFIGLTMTLEAALSTSQTEVTHQLAERIAVILSPRSGPERCRIYDTIRDLYSIRSKLVHGRAGPRKGKILSNTLAVMARRISIPLDKYAGLLQITIEVMQSLMRDKGYLSIIHQTKNDENASQEINSLMRARLLGS